MNRVSSIAKPEKFCGLLLAIFLFAVFSVHVAFASDITPQKIIDLANADRKENKFGDLVENEKLMRVAMDKAEDMTGKNYFSHTSPEGLTPWHWFEKEDYDYNYAGENLAMDFVSAEKMNQAWLDSPTHRANILNEKYKDIGVAVRGGIAGGHKTIVVVQVFGSGDKKAPDGQKKKNVEEKKSGEEKIFAELPLGEETNNAAFLTDPLITVPRKGENIPKDGMEVFGRANPGSKVNIFDQGNQIAGCEADSKGWFKTKISNLSEGEHVLKAESVQSSSGKGREKISSGPEVSFSVDTDKPKLRYKLLSDDSSLKEMIFKISTDKTDCVFEVGGERIFAGAGKSVLVPVKKDKLSVSVSAKDEAGNKSFGEINLTGYYQGRENFDIVREFAITLAPEKIFASDSGQEAIRNNLGLVPRQTQISLAF